MLYSSRQSSFYSGPWWSLLSETTRVFFLLLWATTDLSFIKTGFISVTFPLPLCRLWSNWLPRGQSESYQGYPLSLPTYTSGTYILVLKLWSQFSSFLSLSEYVWTLSVSFYLSLSPSCLFFPLCQNRFFHSFDVTVLVMLSFCSHSSGQSLSAPSVNLPFQTYQRLTSSIITSSS